MLVRRPLGLCEARHLQPRERHPLDGRRAAAQPEAALHVARELAAQPAVQQPPATSSRKRNGRGQFRSEEQPPDMPMDMPSDGVVILEGQFVESGN